MYDCEVIYLRGAPAIANSYLVISNCSLSEGDLCNVVIYYRGRSHPKPSLFIENSLDMDFPHSQGFE